MKKRLYTPLQLYQSISEQNPPAMALPNIQSIEYTSEDFNQLNVDDFISWAISPQFMKSTYQGAYISLNQHLIELYHRIKKKEPDTSYQKCRTEFRDIINIHSIIECWHRYKQAYVFDKDFVQELMQSTTVDIPVEVLKRLPYRCYYLDFSHIDRWNPFIGAFVYVGFQGMNQDIPNIAILRVTSPTPEEQEEMLFSAYFDADHMIQNGMLLKKDPENPSLSKNLMIHLDDSQIFDCKRTALKANSRTMTMSHFEERDLHGFIQFVLQSMLYLASNEPDIRPSSKQKYVYTGPRSTTKFKQTLVLEDVGVRYGNLIRAQKQTQKSSSSDIIVKDLSEKPKRHITSHMRKAHWHTYWTGKGRTIPIVKWIPPTFVCGESSILPVTIHKVKP